MSTAPASYASGLRLARIVLGLLQRPLGWTLEGIAEDLGVGSRTVQRYARTLTTELVDDAGEALVERCRRGEAPALRLRASVGALHAGLYQYAAVMAALRYLPSAQGTVVGDGIDDVLRRMGADGRRALDAQEDMALSFYHATRGAKSYGEHDEILDDLFLAVVRRHPVELEYQPPGRAAFTCRFLPYTLVLYDDGLYLHGDAEFPDREGLHRRLLAVERIRGTRVRRGSHFSHPPGYDPETEFGDRLGVWGGEARSVVLRFHERVAHLVRERRWPGGGACVAGPDGSVELHMTVPHTPELESFVLSFGADVEVVEPRELRRHVAHTVQTLARRYRAQESAP